MLRNEETNSFSAEIKNQALLLLAAYRKLLLAVYMDLCDVKSLKNSVKRRHWAKANTAQYTLVVAKELRIKNLDLEEMILFLNTHHFLKNLPIFFVRKLVGWAPPVVSGTFLIENVLAGYIAQKLLPSEKIKVKADFFVFLPQLEKLYQKHKKQIVCVAPTAEVALTLTDFKKAWIYRLRNMP